MAEASKITNDKQFASLVKAVDENKTKVASLNGTLGERIKHAVDNGHLHAGAFKLICKLYRMDEEKRDEFLRQFDIYRDKAIRMKLFGEEHVGDIVDLAEERERREAEEAEAAQVEENVRRLEDGIKPLNEDEREFVDSTSSKPSRRRKKAEAKPEGEDEAPGTYDYH